MSLKYFPVEQPLRLFDTSNWKSIHEKADQAFAKKDFLAALKNFKYLLDHYPHYCEQDEVLFKCGLASAETGDHALSQKYLWQSFKIKPTSEKLQYLKPKQANNDRVSLKRA